MSIDPRLIERRREVAEDRARKNVGRLIRFLIVIGMLGAVTWLFLSPFLSVREVTVNGIVASDTHRALVEAGIIAGTPMILIRADGVVTDLERDPWVREATVELDWPNQVVVRVEERVPVAWVETSDGWARRAIDGVAVPSATEPDDTLPHIRFPDVTPSDAASSRDMLGALEFSEALAEDLVVGARVGIETNGELWALVSGFEVRLGRPTEMRAKALSLAALLEQEPASGSILTLIAPTHPSVLPPDGGQETDAEQP